MHGIHGTFDDLDIENQLTLKKLEHRDLDRATDSLLAAAPVDIMQVQRLKKRKLLLRDEISKLEAMLIPDIIA